MASTRKIEQDVVVLNDFGFERRDRDAGRGVKSRFTVTISAEPVLFNFSAIALGMGPAKAIAEVIRDKIRGITEGISPATLLRREKAAEHLAAGRRFERDRYTGGRTGSKPPNTIKRNVLFNDSGRLAEGIFVRPNSERGGGTDMDNWTVNVPANRLTPQKGWADPSKFMGMVQRLQSLVPELTLQGASKLVQDPRVENAIQEATTDYLVVKLKAALDQRAAIRAEVRRQGLAILRGIAEVLRAAGAIA